MKRTVVLLALVLCILPACQPVDSGPEVVVTQPSLPPTESAVSTPSLAAIEPTNTPLPPTAAPPTATAVPAANTDDLLAIVQVGLPANAFDGLNVLPLTAPEGERPLWAVHSVGLRNFDLDPWPSHFLAIYTFENGAWQRLARLDLDSDSKDLYIAPDFLFEGGVAQVTLDEDNVWLTVEGGVGAHGGTFQLLRFDGAALHIEVAAAAASPGVGSLADLNDDGVPEVIMGLHDYYVFCYACGVRYLDFQVFAWDAANQHMREISLQPLPADYPAYQPVRRAIELAQADLWPDALAQIEEAQRLADANPAGDETLAWDAAIIRLYHDAWQAEINQAPYPLLTNIFAGEYAPALDIMRGYTHDEIFSVETPLIQGTVAEGFEQWMADYILRGTDAAIAAMPDLAAAYYLRAWAIFLKNPGDPQIQGDLVQAAALDPNELLFAQAAAPPPVRIQFAPGAISATVQGEVDAYESDDYVLRALAGQTMTVVITSANNDVLLTIVGADGVPLTNGLMSGATSWTGTLPATQDYIIRALGTAQPASYTLTVTIE